MQVKVKFQRAAGKSTMTVDATELHKHLDEMSVPVVNGEYADAPPSQYAVINSYNSQVSPRVLCRPGVQTISLSDFYRGALSLETLEQLAESIRPAVQTVLDHYRPVDISVVITGKKVEPT